MSIYRLMRAELALIPIVKILVKLLWRRTEPDSLYSQPLERLTKRPGLKIFVHSEL